MQFCNWSICMRSFSSFGAEIRKLLASQKRDRFAVGPWRVATLIDYHIHSNFFSLKRFWENASKYWNNFFCIFATWKNVQFSNWSIYMRSFRLFAVEIKKVISLAKAWPICGRAVPGCDLNRLLYTIGENNRATENRVISHSLDLTRSEENLYICTLLLL